MPGSNWRLSDLGTTVLPSPARLLLVRSLWLHMARLRRVLWVAGCGLHLWHGVLCLRGKGLLVGDLVACGPGDFHALKFRLESGRAGLLVGVRLRGCWAGGVALNGGLCVLISLFWLWRGFERLWAWLLLTCVCVCRRRPLSSLAWIGRGVCCLPLALQTRMLHRCRSGMHTCGALA